MSDRFCPKCGAYWNCGCRLEELAFPTSGGCEHDWSAVVGVELEDEQVMGEARVLVCRLCGLYAVQQTRQSA
jgi:hypothetical protein